MYVFFMLCSSLKYVNLKNPVWIILQKKYKIAIFQVLYEMFDPSVIKE